MRSRFDDTVGGNAGLYSLAAGAAAAAVLMAITALFPKANTIETGEAETLRAARQARRNAAQERTR
jgi:hypothetical protein